MKEEIIDLDFEFEKIKANYNEKLKKPGKRNLEDLEEKYYNLEFLNEYMDLNEEMFEEIHDIIESIQKKEWFRYTDALEQIKEILSSRLYMLDGMVHPKSERDNNNLCL